MRKTLSWLVILGAIAAVAWLFLRSWEPLRATHTRGAAPLPSHRAERRDAGKLVPREIAPPVAAGEPVTVELMDPPATTYGDQRPEGNDAAHAALIAKLGRPDVVYDPALGHAARELAMQQSLLDGLVPQDIVDWLLRSAGAIDRTVVQAYSATSGDGSEAARKHVEALVGEQRSGGPIRVGIGEVWIPGAKLPRIVGVLVSRREVTIAPAPRRVEPGEAWELSFEMPRGHTDPSALVLRTDGQLEEARVIDRGRRLSVRVPAGDKPGTMVVSIGANGPVGHTTLLQVPVEVGQAVPTTFSTRLPPDESKVRTREAAEPIAFELLNADRARFGLPELVRDPRLDAIARAHSEDMRDHGFFGHLSPTTGQPGDRLARASYRSVAHAENLAAERSLHAAESSLLASLGHRRNILSTDVTHVGIGVALHEEGGRIAWHVTQLFSKPVTAIDEGAEEGRVRAAIAEARKAAGIAALGRDPGLDRIARDHARSAAEGKLDGLAKRALDDASRAGLTSGGARAWVQRTSDASAFEAPAEGSEAAWARVGIGVVQLRDDPHGMTGIVVILAGD